MTREAKSLAHGGDAQRQKRVDGIPSAGVDRRAGAGVAQGAARGPGISLEKAVVGWVFASDVANEHAVLTLHAHNLGRRLRDETVGRAGGDLDRPQIGTDEDGLQSFTEGK